MKNISFSICFFCCFSLLNFAQNTFSYFHKTYATDTTNVLTPTSYPLGDGYLTVGGFNSFNHYSALYVQKTDLKGNLVWHKVLEDGYEMTAMFGGKTLTPTSDGNFVTVGEKATSDADNGNLRAIIIKFDKEGEVIWKKFHGDSTTVIALRSILETPDKGIIMAGTKRLVEESSRCYILKIDSLGNIQWEKLYYPDRRAKLLNIQATPDSGYIASGYRFRLTGTYPTNIDAYIMKIDSLGTLVWEKTFGGNHLNLGAQLMVLPSGESVMTYGLGIPDHTPAEHDNPTPLQILKLDKEGNVLLEKEHKIEKTRAISSSILQTADNGFIAVGSQQNIWGYLNWLIYRFDENLDTLWTKPIFHSHETYEYVRDIVATPDKGYLLTGFISTTQESWLVKIDSLGNTCSYVGCDSTINLQPPLGISNFPKQNTLKISPNPIQNAQKATITLPNISLYHQVTLQVFNATGQLVQEQWVLPYQKELLLTTKGLSNGLYFCRLVGDGQRIEEGKLVVAH